jgi:hypothetical protein
VSGLRRKPRWLVSEVSSRDPLGHQVGALGKGLCWARLVFMATKAWAMPQSPASLCRKGCGPWGSWPHFRWLVL